MFYILIDRLAKSLLDINKLYSKSLFDISFFINEILLLLYSYWFELIYRAGLNLIIMVYNHTTSTCIKTNNNFFSKLKMNIFCWHQII